MCIYFQYLAPQHTLSRLAGWISNCRTPWLKNWIISRFIKKFNIDMKAAVLENIDDYPSFNSFFTRQLKPELRPIVQGANQIACPADGFVSQIGHIQHDSLLQAKGRYFELADLVGTQERAKLFQDGEFATFYLSPKDYHRVHMPLGGKLRETIYIPGKLFSVSQETTRKAPNLFARNERLVCIFDTEIGPMAVILVGAMLVGSINTVWDSQIVSNRVEIKTYSGNIELARGAEMGHFKMGSTAIVLFAKDKMSWSQELKEDTMVRMGQLVGTFKA
jgi:phosphatidylserine decarboxylase